jgi:hypothetical protein
VASVIRVPSEIGKVCWKGLQALFELGRYLLRMVLGHSWKLQGT